VVENKRDFGLVRVVGPWALAAGMVNMVVGAAIFTIPGELAAALGPYAPLAFLFCAVAVGCVAICFAEGGSRIPTSGGPYGYIEAVFGPLVGAVVGTLFWIGNVLSAGAVAAALANLVASPVSVHLATIVRVTVVIGVVGTVALVNISSVAHGARLAAVTTVLKLVPLAVFVIVGAFAVHGGNFSRAVEPGTGDLGRALIPALFAFIGAETPLSASGEVSNPSRSIPRALAIAMLGVALLYVAVQVVAQGILGPALALSPAPLADAMARISPALRWLMMACGALSMFGWICSDTLGSPRILFAFARDGLLPRALGRLHSRNHTPFVAILCYCAAAIGLALSGTFAELLVLSTLPVAVLYSVGCAAAWVLARRGVVHAGEPLNFRLLGAAAAAGIASMLFLIALAGREEIWGLLMLVGASTAVYYFVRARSPARA
jgi:APA family basic amino acid/polyamine antiporter